jgi:1,4-dihydroxy-2-naphthoate octaprenyltransferase
LEILLSLYLAGTMNLVGLPIITVICIMMGSVYSLEPFRLSYKGYGELVQALSLGLFLPYFGYYYTANDFWNYPIHTALVLMPVFGSSNVVHALPDFPSDLMSKRKTFVVMFGEFYCRKLVLISYFVSTFFAIWFKTQESNIIPYILLFWFDCGILLFILSNGLLYNSNVQENREKCKLFVRVNMFALIGHVLLWLVAFSWPTGKL